MSSVSISAFFITSAIEMRFFWENTLSFTKENPRMPKNYVTKAEKIDLSPFPKAEKSPQPTDVIVVVTQYIASTYIVLMSSYSIPSYANHSPSSQPTNSQEQEKMWIIRTNTQAARTNPIMFSTVNVFLTYFSLSRFSRKVRNSII